MHGFSAQKPAKSFADFPSVRSLITENTCAICLETVQGEGGIYPATDTFMQGIRKLCDEHDILMISDEIQCGMGRSGKMFAYQNYSVLPDIVVSAKALGCGVPVGAIGTRGPATGVLGPGDHGTTYGSNPLATAAVVAVFTLYKQYGILSHVTNLAAYLDQALKELAEKKSIVKEIRGLGLMKGIELSVPAKPYIEALQKEGILVIPSGTNVIRLLPPLILEEEHVNILIQVLDSLF